MRVAIRDEKAVLQAIDLCADLEERALLIYEQLRASAEDERLGDLWAAMAVDEREHRAYWVRLKEACAAGAVPEVFDEPRRYVDELKALQQRLEHVAVSVRSEFRPPRVFIHALRLEFLLLHPAIVALFHYLPEEGGARSPRLTYEQHLGKLLNVLMDYESLPPELELLGEAIGQVWRKSVENATRAVSDILTGVLNRRGLWIAMKPLAYLARRERQPAAVFIVEVANIKEINNAHGRRIGDQVLAAVAAAILGRMRSSDVVGRFGGDDFLVLLTRFDPAHLAGVAAEILERGGAASVGDARPALALGGAWAMPGGDVEEHLETLIRAADGALLAAREEKGRCHLRQCP